MVAVTIQKVRLHRVKVPLKQPFSTHLQTVKERESILVEMIEMGGEIGLGECVAFSSPWYTEETVQSCWDALQKWLIPEIVGKTFQEPSELFQALQFIKGNRMAKAALDLASWDLFAKKTAQPLWQFIGGVRDSIDVGIVLTGSVDAAMFSRVEAARKMGYRRVKIKIDGATNVQDLKQLVDAFPHMLFYGDGNGIFHKLGMEALVAFDEVGLTLIEQPFLDDDWALHEEATRLMTTPIALDESIRSYADVERMVEKDAGRIIVLKSGRVGGITETLNIHELAKIHQLPMWIGGMIELGVSKAHNLALASLTQMQLPGDFSASNHYWEEDIVTPAIMLENGRMKLSNRAGIGVALNHQVLQTYCVESWHSNCLK